MHSCVKSLDSNLLFGFEEFCHKAMTPLCPAQAEFGDASPHHHDSIKQLDVPVLSEQ